MASYALDNAWERARHRLALLEHHLDPMSHQRLAALGVREGWQCLEVGGGGGLVTRWLCHQVGTSGHVTATDIDIRFLQEIKAPNLKVQHHDVTADRFPEAQFDLVHTRWLLHHLPHPEQVVARMVAALRPGGWLLLEEPELFPHPHLRVPALRRLHGRVGGHGSGTFGAELLLARALPALVAGQGLAEVGGAGDSALLRGGSPIAEFFQLTGEQIRDKVLAAGALGAERFEAALALLDDPTFWAFAGASIALWGRRPMGG
jgi:SAM-dependent methyltransferase